MKRIILFLLIAISFCPIAEAKKKTITYRNGYNSYYCKCTGTFYKRHLCDGTVEFRYFDYGRQPRIILTGEYSKPDYNLTTPTDSINTFTGLLTYKGVHGELQFKCSGLISNCYAQERSFDISSESKHTNWLLNLRFTEIINPSFNMFYEIDSVLINERFIGGRSLAKKRNTQWKELVDYLGGFYTRDIQATIYFANGDRYSGPIYHQHSIWHIGTLQTSTTTIPYITYHWHNGDYFEGTATLKGYRIIPIKGKMTYADGTHDNDWSIRYEEIDYFTYETTLTQFREIIAKKREKERLVELAEQQYKAEQARKEAELKAEQARKEAEKAEKEAERKRKIIQKYGQKYGQLIIDKELALGMTKEMCEQVVHFEYYDVQTYSSGGHTYEKWTYNSARLKGEVFRQDAEAVKFFNAMSILLWCTGNSMDNIAAPYKMLKFTDGKLTDMY